MLQMYTEKLQNIKNIGKRQESNQTTSFKNHKEKGGSLATKKRT